jgi:hypothetical protein
MAIIKPSLVFEGSHLGNRNDPEPGDYTARLLSVQFTNERKSHIRMEWELTNHPATGYNWRVQRTYTLSPDYIRFLNHTLWWWKRKNWDALGKNDAERMETMQRWIGDEANIRVTPWNPENPRLVNVSAVCSLGLSFPPFGANEEVESD